MTNPLVATPADQSAPVLEARAISKSFPGVRALDNVNLRLRPGRLLALVGENGAGKSTLMNICAGVFTPDSGQLLVDNREVNFHSPRDASAHGITAIFQELSLLPNLSVSENIFLGREPRTRIGLIDYKKMSRDAEVLLARMNLHVAPQTPAGQLRVGQQQVIEIARALSIRARVLIMDEPTSALSHQEIKALMALIVELKRAGVAIVYITHKFEELADVGDDVAIMRDGRVVAQSELAAISHAQIVRQMVGREPTEVYGRRRQREVGQQMLRVEHVSLPHASRRGDFVVRDVALTVARGEVLGIFGLMGAGRTELLETIFGAHADRAVGDIFIEGQAMRLSSPAEAIESGLALAPEDRKQDGLVLSMSSRENASLACLRDSARWGLLSPRREMALVRPLLERMRLRAASMEHPVSTLSGGNQQKVILAKWLGTTPKVLLLDEPTRGIDINAKNEIYALIDELAHAGLAVIMVSSELPEVLALSDRIIVMCEGRKIAEFTADAVNSELLMHAALPRGAAGALAC
jgi:ribose transport system ATP-binding protein